MKQANTNEAVVQAVVEATRTAIQATAVTRTERTQNLGLRLGGPIMKQPTFNCEAEDKYYELKNFRVEVNNIFELYSTPRAEQIAIIKKLLGRKGLQFLETLTQMEQERFNTIEGLFTMLNNKFKPQYNEIIKSSHFHKLGRQMDEIAEEWMGKFRLAAVECNYKETDN